MKRSIRYQIIFAFIGLAIGPLILGSAIFVRQGFLEHYGHERRIQNEVTKRISAEISAFIGEVVRDLQLTLTLNNLSEMSRQEQTVLLGTLQVKQKTLRELRLLDGEGFERAHASQSKVYAPIDFHDWSGQTEFSYPKRKTKIYFSPVWFDALNAKPLMNIALPSTNLLDGVVDNVLVAEIDLSRLWSLIAGIDMRVGENVFLVDAQGRLIAHRNPSVVLKNKKLTQHDRVGWQTGLGGRPVLRTVKQLRFGDQAFAVVAELEKKYILQGILHQIWISLLLMLLIIFVASGIGIAIAKKIISPLKSLVTVAKKIQSGDLSQQAPPGPHVETAELANTFNSMTRQLSLSIQDLQNAHAEMEDRVAQRTKDLVDANKNLHQEIEARTRAEETIRESEAQLKAITNTAKDAVIMMNQMGEIEFWNPAAEKIFGFSIQEAMNQNLHNLLVPPEYHAPFHKGFPKFKETGQGAAIGQTLELKALHKNGVMFPVELSLSAIKIEGQWHAIGILRDISERKANEAERERLIDDLQEALAKVKTLSGFLPVCANCKKIRDDGGYWNQIESYIEAHSEAEFSHSICPECEKELYPELFEENE